VSTDALAASDGIGFCVNGVGNSSPGFHWAVLTDACWTKIGTGGDEDADAVDGLEAAFRRALVMVAMGDQPSSGSGRRQAEWCAGGSSVHGRHHVSV
jgi:hypothetical protein